MKLICPNLENTVAFLLVLIVPFQNFESTIFLSNPCVYLLY